ncbi:MAG: hypothetical protein F4138_04565 [Acidimicrobiia bacterium]|nr:hypothetical protein [Acidimicrobiia bacterium]MYC58493.1 hypothetical protein [Acidimicrobiia bacterium]MYG94251.1 hypothetical protein [Acidimicrobiia bacterium]MYI30401.1 hypothetical protein [Acidimicrobiia bacterium]
MVEDLKNLIIAYARQEIVAPLLALGKTLKYGILGAFSLGIGLIFLSIAGLRLLQTEASGVFDNNLSVLAYLVVLVGLLTVIALVLLGRSKISRSTQKANQGQLKGDRP